MRDDEIERLYVDDGLPQAAIGELFGITESRVCQILRARGLDASKGAWHKRGVAARTRAEIERAHTKALREDVWRERASVIERMWAEDYTTFAIAAELGIEPSHVGRYARRLGLPARERGERRSDAQRSRAAEHTPGAEAWRSSYRERARRQPRIGRTPTRARAPRPDSATRELQTVASAAFRRCCDGELIVECPCGRRRCEDHALMTTGGPRCEVCATAA